MRFSRKRFDDYFFRGLGAEFVFKTSDGISLVSGGRVLKVRMESTDGDSPVSRIVLVEPDNARHVIFEGTALAAASKLVEIGVSATTTRSRISVSRRVLYAALAAFTAVYLVFCHPVRQGGDLATLQATNELGALLKDIPTLARGGAPGLNLPAGVMSPVPSAIATPGAASTVVDKPEFLSLPEDAAPQETSALPKASAADTSEVAAIPSYSADLYKTAPVDAVTKPASDSSAVPGKAAPSDDKAMALLTERAEKERETPAKKPEVAVVETPSKQPDIPVTQTTVTQVATPAKAPSESSAKADARGASPPAVQKPEDIKAIATNATKGMSANDTADVLKQIEQMMAMDPTSITPDMLSKLPHDIAQALRDTGVLENPGSIPEKGDAPYAAIRLPAGVIDKFRGRDGIASIPENDTYAALGNRIPLQLPGGGDIRRPEDLEAFGFRP